MWPPTTCRIHVCPFLSGATVPELSVEVKATTDEKNRSFFEQYGGKSFPKEYLEQAHAGVEELCNILRHEGVIVRRPEIMNFSEVKDISRRKESENTRPGPTRPASVLRVECVDQISE